MYVTKKLFTNKKFPLGHLYLKVTEYKYKTSGVLSSFESR